MRPPAATLLVTAVVVWLGAGPPARADDPVDLAAGIRFTRYAVTAIGTLGGPNSEAWSLNNAGQVVGRADIAPDAEGNVYYHAFLWEGGVITDLGTIPDGCNPLNSNSWAYDINDAGQVVGDSCDYLQTHAFVWSNGVMLDLGTLGGTTSGARAINNAGDVVGAALDSSASQHPFLYRGNTMRNLTPVGPWGWANDINDVGTVVGVVATPWFHAFLYSGNTFTDLFPGGRLDSRSSYGEGINDAGTVVGGHGSEGFVYRGGVVTYVGSLANSFTEATSINNLDEVVGHSALGAGDSHAFLYRNGTIVDLNDHIPDHPEWDLNRATSINDAGQIVGIGTLDGQTRGFLLTPVQTAPTAVDDAYATPFGAQLTVPAPGVLGNDYGSGLIPMTAALVTPPSHGSVVLGRDGGIVYTPVPGYSGPDAFAYRAINTIGPSNLATASLTVGEAPIVQPPTSLYAHEIAGHLVTLRWVPPLGGPRPTGYAIEGGVQPGEVLAVIPTGTSHPLHTFVAPSGSFYLRVRALAGAGPMSAASNEIRVHVAVPTPPSEPIGLTSVVQGSTVHLAWRNTFTGGPPSDIVLQAYDGRSVWHFPLGLTESFTVSGVPDGYYSLSVWARNAAGASNSTGITIGVPSECTGPPGVPADFLAYALGRTIYVVWEMPTPGPAATSYELIVAGAYSGRFPTSGRALSGTVGPGTYELSVFASNPCGDGPATPVQTITIR